MHPVPSITLTPDELHALTGYRRPAEQLRALHLQGYWRARRSVLGAVVLTRAHYEAVEGGQDRKPALQAAGGPKLRVV